MIKLFDYKAVFLRSSTPKVLCIFFSVMIFLQIISGFKAYVSRLDLQQIHIPKVDFSSNQNVSHQSFNAPMFGVFLSDDLANQKRKVSRLQVKLIGIARSENEAESAVFLELPGGEQKIFHVGDEIPGGAVIQRVSQTEVYVIDHGHVEYLFLPEKQINLDSSSSGISFEK